MSFRVRTVDGEGHGLVSARGTSRPITSALGAVWRGLLRPVDVALPQVGNLLVFAVVRRRPGNSAEGCDIDVTSRVRDRRRYAPAADRLCWPPLAGPHGHADGAGRSARADPRRGSSWENYLRPLALFLLGDGDVAVACVVEPDCGTRTGLIRSAGMLGWCRSRRERGGAVWCTTVTSVDCGRARRSA